jgi:type IV pilus assembly protein PilO
MPIPKFSDLSATVQVVVILVVGVALWGVSEYLLLQPLKTSNAAKQAQATKLEKEVAPLRPYRERVRALEAENQQLENQLANLRRIVPNESEVDNFIRMLQTEAATSGVAVRRFTAKAPVTQQYDVEVPFEMELDGAFYDVLQFYERLGRLERITNVSDLKMDAIQTGTSKTVGKYNYGSNETVTAVCTVITFFSREGEPAPAAGAKTPARRAPARPAAPARR